jgi:hypothetical protein
MQFLAELGEVDGLFIGERRPAAAGRDFADVMRRPFSAPRCKQRRQLFLESV